jgi:hypothetical protein
MVACEIGFEFNMEDDILTSMAEPQPPTGQLLDPADAPALVRQPPSVPWPCAPAGRPSWHIGASPSTHEAASGEPHCHTNRATSP